MIPAWLQRHLEAAGRWNTDGVSRAVSSGTCPRCKSAVLRGLDADPCGLAITADPIPTTAVGELLALTAGRRTVSLAQRAGQWQINARDPWHIRSPRPAVLLAEHACHSPPLPAAPMPDSPAPTSPAPARERCPF